MNAVDGRRGDIEAELEECAAVMRATAQGCGQAILQAAEVIAASLQAGGKVLLCGNGGSAADAQHIAAELVGRMKLSRRPALAALSLTADTSALTALGNDYGYGAVFERQLEALARPGDVLVAISTSGRSANVLRAVAAAAEIGLTSVGLTGNNGGPLSERVDISIRVPSADVQRIQEAHIAIGHIICSLVERMLTEKGRAEEDVVLV